MADTFTPEQITQILEEFFKVVGTRKYIGERYVPIFGRKGEESIQWDNSAPYEPLTIVLYQGNSYTSRQYVPIGIEITNQEFWVITGNYNAQVEAYHRETIAAREIADNAITTANNAQNDIDTLLPKADFSAENTVKKYIDENPTRILTFDTVAAMQAATNLLAGMTCHTNGFHASGDGGAAYYTVSASGTANGMDVLTLQNGLYATLVVTEPYVTPEMFGAYGDGTHDDTTAIQKAIESGRAVNLGDDTFYCATSIDVTYYKEIFGGTLKLADSAQLIIRNYSSVHDITIELDSVSTDGVVFISNAYTLNGDSNLKNVFDSVWFKVINSPNVVLFKLVAYSVSTSPTGRIGTSGLLGYTVSNVHVNSARIKRFAYIETDGGWITTGLFHNCWCGLPTICIETVNSGTSIESMSGINFYRVQCQYVSGLSHYAYLALGRYYFDDCICYDSNQHFIVFKNTRYAIATVLKSVYTVENVAMMEDENGNFTNATLQIKEFTSARATDQLAPITLASNRAVTREQYKAASNAGYIQPHSLGSSAATQGNTAVIGQRYVVGNLFTLSYVDRYIGISSQGHAVFAEVDSTGAAKVHPFFTSQAGAYGTTAQRPSNPSHGAQFFDTDLKKPIWFYNSHWYTADGTDVTA